QLPLEQVETRMLMFNHADLMDRILNAWQFPKSLIEPIAMHHLSAGNIRNLSPQIIAEASTLALANRLAHAMLLAYSGYDCLSPTDEFVDVLELQPETIKFIEDQIPEQTTDMKYAMLQSGTTPVSSDYRELVLSKFSQSIHALYIGANPSIDGYRILF